jgi:urease accessory protein
MKRLADDSLPPAIHTAHCRAELELGFADDAGTTRLVKRRHYGPLRVQKPLYPESAAVCHAIVVHPPGGVVGGDELQISARVGANASAFITTPGAAKWYKANGSVSRQQVRLEVGADAALEWLPQETIFFDAAQVRLEHNVELAEGARYIGGETLCFGRTASGESFRSGRISQRTSIRRAGKLVWFEQGGIAAGAAMHSPLGLAGHTVSATLIAAGVSLPTGVAGQLRSACEGLHGADSFGATQMKSVVVVRYLGDSSEQARHLMIRAWQVLRPVVLGRDAVMPRIWNT